MDDRLRNLNERIEDARGRLNEAESLNDLMVISREVDDLVNLYMRLSYPPGFPGKRAGCEIPPVDRGGQTGGGG